MNTTQTACGKVDRDGIETCWLAAGHPGVCVSPWGRIRTEGKTMDASIGRGRVGFGAVGGHPPARWRYEGRRNGSYELTHVARPGQTPFPPQFVDRATVERLMRSE